MKRILETLRNFAALRRELAAAMKTEAEIREAKILAAQDLNHAFLQKTLEAMPDGTEMRVYLHSGEAVEIIKRQTRPPETPKEGTLTW